MTIKMDMVINAHECAIMHTIFENNPTVRNVSLGHIKIKKVVNDFIDKVDGTAHCAMVLSLLR